MHDSPSKVFISYDREDVAYVGAVADHLGLQGVDPWFDETRPTIRAFWHDKTAATVAASEVVIVFLGDHTDSTWMNFEIGVAVGGEKTVVPVYLSEAGRRHLPSLFAEFDGIDARSLMPDEVASRIATAIRAVA
jgi:hypothetical protein